MKALVTQWLNSHAKELRLFENNDEIRLRHHSNTVLLSVQLTQHPPDKALLQTCMRLGGVSLDHFQGALAQVPASGELLLIHCLHDGQDEKRLLGCLESLLNQRDTWRSVAARLARTSQNFTPSSLRSLPR